MWFPSDLPTVPAQPGRVVVMALTNAEALEGAVEQWDCRVVRVLPVSRARQGCGIVCREPCRGIDSTTDSCGAQALCVLEKLRCCGMRTPVRAPVLRTPRATRCARRPERSVDPAFAPQDALAPNTAGSGLSSKRLRRIGSLSPGGDRPACGRVMRCCCPRPAGPAPALCAAPPQILLAPPVSLRSSTAGTPSGRRPRVNGWVR